MNTLKGGDIVLHPIFGMGQIAAQYGDGTVDVVFADGERNLNRSVLKRPGVTHEQSKTAFVHQQ